MTVPARLLIVDDEANLLKTYQRVFQESGWELFFAGSGEEAVRAAPDVKPDIVVLDIMMPGIDGYEVCRKIKALKETRDAEVIFVSAKGSLPDRLKGYRVQGSDFLVKPFSPEELVAKIEVALERKRAYKDAALIDELTKTGNRRFFNAEFDELHYRSIRLEKIFSLALIDIDHFKKINDTYGHSAGDLVLKKLSLFLKDSIRKDDFIARIGGEEFGMLMPEASKTNAVSILERLRIKVASKRFKTPGLRSPLRITISAGISTFPDDGMEKADLIEKADSALYLAKQRGRNRLESAL